MSFMQLKIDANK